jgi:hypothetical protein
LLSLFRDVLPLVIGAEQQGQLVTVCVAEEPILDLRAPAEAQALWHFPATSAGGIDSRLWVAVKAKLENALAKLPAEARTEDVRPIGLKDLQDGGADKPPGVF